VNESGKRSPAKLFWVVILLIVLYAALDILAQSLPPYYSPVRQPESDLAVGTFGFIMTLNFLNRGVLSLVFIFAFLETLDRAGVSRSHFRTGVCLLSVWAIGAILLALFQTDVPATPVSWHGAIHLVVAVAAFIGGAFGTVAISRNIRHYPALEGLNHVALPTVVFVMICFVAQVVVLFVPVLNAQIGGLIERVFLGSVLLWIGLVSAYLATHVPVLDLDPDRRIT
jgi:hypothetical protein